MPCMAVAAMAAYDPRPWMCVRPLLSLLLPPDILRNDLHDSDLRDIW